MTNRLLKHPPDDLSGDYSQALANILEDSLEEKAQLVAAQSAVLNILEDAAAERDRLQMAQKAVFNILDDLRIEKSNLERAQEELVRSEHEIRASLGEKEAMLKEIHHRVKNNLQVISSLLNLQSEHISDAAAQRMFGESQGRIRSMALVHEKLYESKDLSHVNFDEYVRALIHEICYGSDAERRGIAVNVDIQGIGLAIDTAIPCGLIINELITNSLKHAFPAGRAGRIGVELRRDRPDRLELVVWDDGIGLPEAVVPHTADSFGLALVFTFAEQLDAKVDVGQDRGTRYEFRFAEIGQ